MKKIFSLLLFIFFLSENMNAQIEIPSTFQELLTATQGEFLQPLENRYKKTKVNENYILTSDFAIRSKKKDLEIRFHLIPEKEGDPLNNVPHMRCFNKANSVATNDEEARVAYHEMSKEERKKYNADWGATFFFQPKDTFSKKKDCKLITLYAEGKGIAMIFYLFDEATEEVDVQEYCFTFNPPEVPVSDK